MISCFVLFCFFKDLYLLLFYLWIWSFSLLKLALSFLGACYVWIFLLVWLCLFLEYLHLLSNFFRVEIGSLHSPGCHGPLFCRQDWSWTQKYTCLCLLHAEIKGVSHYVQFADDFLRFISERISVTVHFSDILNMWIFHNNNF